MKRARNEELLVEAIDSHIKNSDRWHSEEGMDELLPFWNSYNKIASNYDKGYYKECLPILKLIIIFAALISAAQVAAIFAILGGHNQNSTISTPQEANGTACCATDQSADPPTDETLMLEWLGFWTLLFSFSSTLVTAMAAFIFLMEVGAGRRQFSQKAAPQEKALYRHTFHEGQTGIRSITYFLAGSLLISVLTYFVAIAFLYPFDGTVGFYGFVGLLILAVWGGVRFFRRARRQRILQRLRIPPHSKQAEGPLRYRDSVERDIRMITFAAGQTPQVEQYRQDLMHILQALFTISPVLFIVPRHRRLISAVPWAHIFEFLCAKYVTEGSKSLDQYDEKQISDVAQILVFLTMPGEWQGLKITQDFLKGIRESNMEGVRGDVAILISLAGTRRGAFEADFDSLWNQYCADAAKIPQSTTRWFIRSAPPLPSTQVLAESVLRIDQSSSYTLDDLQNITYFLTAFTSLMVPEGVKSFDKHSACITLSSYSTLMASVASWNPDLDTLDSQIHLYYARIAGKDVKYLSEFWSLVDSGTWSPLRVDVIHALLYGLTHVLPTVISYPSSRQDANVEYQALVSENIGPLLGALSPRNLLDGASSTLLLQTNPAIWLIETIGRFDNILTGQYSTPVTGTAKELATDKKPPNIAKLTTLVRRGWPRRFALPMEDREAKLDLEAYSTATFSTARVPAQQAQTISPSERRTILRLLTEHLIPICHFLIPTDFDFSPHRAELEPLTDPSLRIIASVISGIPAIGSIPALEISKPVDPALVIASSFLVAKIDLIHSSEVVQLAKPLLLTEDEAACLGLTSALLDRPEIFNNDGSNIFDATFIRHLLDVGTSPKYQVESITIIQRLIQLPWAPTVFIDRGGMEFLSQNTKHSSVATAVLSIVLHVLSLLRNAEDLKSAVCVTEKALSVLNSQDAQYDGTELAEAFIMAAASILSDISPASTIWRPTVAGLVGRLQVHSTA